MQMQQNPQRQQDQQFGGHQMPKNEGKRSQQLMQQSRGVHASDKKYNYR